MIVKIYSIYDCKVECYGQPFFMQANGAAVRAFSEVVADKSTGIGKYPADYTLFEIGSFDDATCKFDMLVSPRSLGVGSEFIRE